MQWTHEQQPIINSEADKLLIQAFAGTRKTTTLVGYAKHHAAVKLLYLCYNKSVELTAKGRFPRNVISRLPTGWPMRCMALNTPTNRPTICA